ncbi:MAG TPA: hypothetical protein VJU02_08645 [Nitrospiraceae bacterium]|nr:hypothetical protein [Nitrospiraceae bacterium]
MPSRTKAHPVTGTIIRDKRELGGLTPGCGLWGESDRAAPPTWSHRAYGLGHTLPLFAVIGGLMLFGLSHGLHPPAVRIALDHTIMGTMSVNSRIVQLTRALLDGSYSGPC